MSWHFSHRPLSFTDANSLALWREVYIAAFTRHPIGCESAMIERVYWPGFCSGAAIEARNIPRCPLVCVCRSTCDCVVFVTQVQRPYIVVVPATVIPVPRQSL